MTIRQQQLVMALAVFLLLSLSSIAQSVVYYVKPGGSDLNSGLSWEAAKRTVQSGVDLASGGGEVWVANGIYRERITLRPGVGLYGSFTEGATSKSDRDLSARLTVLDGMKLGSVMTAKNLSSACMIDGLTIQNGSGTAALGVSYGGGVYCINSSLTVANCTITMSSATGCGGGIYCYDSSFTITSSTISGNKASGLGGGLYCHGGSGSLAITGSLIASNTNTGLYLDSSSPSVTSNTISGNTAGGIYCNQSAPAISYNTIFENSADVGGGITCSSSSPLIFVNLIWANTDGIACVGSSSPQVVNNTIVGSTGRGVYCESPALIANNIVAFNYAGVANSGGSPTLRCNCSYGNTAGDWLGLGMDPTGVDGNMSVDPELASAVYGNLHIQSYSRCRDAGDGTAVDPEWTDIDGQQRAVGAGVDIGADESDGTTWHVSPRIVRVATTGSDGYDGSSWESPKRTVQAAIDAAAERGGEVWVAAGTYSQRITLRPFVYVYGGFNGFEVSRSERDWRANPVILDGGQAGTVVTSISDGHRLSAIDGFTICNGKAADGGGIYCSYSSPSMMSNIIRNNAAAGTGAGSGAGIYIRHSSPLVAGDILWQNMASANGGGISCTDGSAPLVANNTLVANSALQGGAIYSSESSPEIWNNVAAWNSSGVCSAAGAATVVRYNCVYGNTHYDYSWLPDPTGSDGNISCDPRFVDAAAGDFHLQPDSLCIDAGGDAVVQPDWLDMDAQPRVCGLHVDIGADEWLPIDTVAAPLFDLPGGVYYAPIEVVVTCPTDGAVTHYTTNGLDPTTSDPVAASGSTVAVPSSLTLKARAWKTGWVPSSVTSAAYTITGAVATPAFSPDGGTYAAAIGVVVSCSTPGAVIHYTVNGVAPTESDPVVASGGSVAVGRTLTLKAKAWKTDWLPSEVESADYRIRPPGILYVNAKARGPTHDGMSWGSAYLTIADALGASISGDEIWVAAGTYVGSVTLRGGAALYGGFAGTETARSQRDWRRNVTIMDGGKAGRVVMAPAGIAATAVVSGFTIRNGQAEVGGGIFCDGSTQTITNNTITGNSAGDGGGIYCASGAGGPLIANNLISKNTASRGAGIFCAGGSPDVTNNTVVSNTATVGGGLYLESSSARVRNNIISTCSSGVLVSGGAPVLRSNCVSGNPDYNYQGIADPTGSSGNISAVPGFISPEGGNYHLQTGSPCIDKGDGSAVGSGWTDIDGRLRVYGPSVDIGADEWTTPANVSLAPNSGGLPTGAKLTLKTTYSDPDGWTDLSYGCLLINTMLSGTNTAYFYYDAAANKLYVRDDANTKWVGGYAPGSANTIENSYCRLYCAESTTSGSGTNLTVNWKILFKASMSGRNCAAWLRACNWAGVRTGWDQKASFKISQAPANVSLAPNSGGLPTGTKLTIKTTCSDPDGCADIAYTCLVINTVLSGTNTAYFYYDAAANKLYVRDDANTKWMGGYAPGSANTVENSYCRLYCAETTTSGSGTNLTVNWRILLKASMSGRNCLAWVLVADRAGLRAGWEQKGSFKISQPPANVSLTPNSGTLATNTKLALATVYSDPDGSTDLAYGCFLINTVLSGTNTAYFYYDAAANKLYVRDDANTKWVGGYAPGSANTIENSYCRLYCAETTAAPSGTNLTLTWRILLKASMSGRNCSAWMIAVDRAGLRAGWEQKGGFSVR